MITIIIVSSGALDNLQVLNLYNNQIGDAGMSALADACASGALDNLQELWIATPSYCHSLKAACKTKKIKLNGS